MKHSTIKSLKITLAALLCLLLPACGRRYQSKPLSEVYHTAEYDYTESKNDITVQIKKLSKQECKDIFGSRGDKPLSHNQPSKRIHPLLLSVKNENDSNHTLAPENINLNLSTPEKFAESVYTKTGLIIAGIAIPGALISGYLLATVILDPFIAILQISMIPMLFLAGQQPQLNYNPLSPKAYQFIQYSSVAAPLATVAGSTYFGMRSSQYNANFSLDLQKKSLFDTMIIKPAQTIHKLIYIAQPDYKSNFDLTVHDAGTDAPTTFNVQLPELN